MTSTGSIRPGDYVPTADRRVILHGFDWAGFQALIELRGDRRWRIAYLDGAVELMTPSRGHERTKSLLGRLVETYCIDREIVLEPTGAWLLQDESEQAGAEPDESYVFGADPDEKIERPDLVVEVAWSRGGIRKLEIYRRLGVKEVWMWEDDAIAVHVLGPAGYERRDRSACLAEIDLAVLAELCTATTLNDAVRGLRKRLPR